MALEKDLMKTECSVRGYVCRREFASAYSDRRTSLMLCVCVCVCVAAIHIFMDVRWSSAWKMAYERQQVACLESLRRSSHSYIMTHK